MATDLIPSIFKPPSSLARAPVFFHRALFYIDINRFRRFATAFAL